MGVARSGLMVSAQKKTTLDWLLAHRGPIRGRLEKKSLCVRQLRTISP